MSTRPFVVATTCLAAFASAIVVVGGVAVATHDAQTLHGCAHNKTGALRLVEDAGQCSPNEFAVDWNRQGPTGEQGPPGAAVTCAAGTRYFVGVCFDDTARGAKTIRDANADCADEAGRLPTSAEMYALARQSGVAIAGAEWSMDMGNHEGVFDFLAFSQNGNGLQDALDPLAYRCVTAPLG